MWFLYGVKMVFADDICENKCCCNAVGNSSVLKNCFTD